MSKLLCEYSENDIDFDENDEYLENIGKKDKEEIENLKKENARLSELVNVLEEHIKVLNTQLRLQRELASKQEFNPFNQMQISRQELDFLTRQNTISQMSSFQKKQELNS